MTNVAGMQEFDITEISPIIQDYLSLIYVMERDGDPVIGSRLAELLGVTPPTVTNTLKRMTRDGLITMNQEGTHLTETGWAAGKVIMRRHMLMEWMMVKTLPWAKLHGEAHHLEHAISNAAETALLEQLGNPKTCPHGNPLPGNEAAVESWVPLTEAKRGEVVIIRRIHELAEEKPEVLDFLESNQITPGQHVRVSEILPFNHTITLEVGEKSVTLGNVVAKYIFIER
ncbi:MAG: metal-dependent transcriptional regulator [Anaerolineaceae bacterium]|nr:metal-dependent transcriptional regulator [Anaerolineaceae bacterium]